MSSVAQLLGHLVGNDAHWLATTELFLGERAAIDEREVVDAEEVGVTSYGKGVHCFLLLIIADD